MPADPFYASPAWRDLRRSILSARPACSIPGCARPASHVDHIQTRRTRPDLALVRSNLAPYCHGCHSAKTVRRDGGFGNAPSKGRIAAKGCDADGNPRDPSHPWNVHPARSCDCAARYRRGRAPCHCAARGDA